MGKQSSAAGTEAAFKADLDLLVDLRRHVVDDATELASLLGLAVPLLKFTMAASFQAVPKSEGTGFLRRHLTRSVALVLFRMHDQSSSGRTGATASLPAIFGLAEALFPQSKFGVFNEVRAACQARFGTEERVPGWAEASFEEWKAFRHAELAHSILPKSEPSKNLLFGPLVAFARQTVQLLEDFDRALVETGSFPGLRPYVRREMDEWEAHGANFWS